LHEHFEIYVFTASHPYYAEHVINILDPNKTIFSKRFFRSSCIQNEGLYIKDLRVLNCDLNSTLIVDNSILSFASQLDNGIPVIPFYEDKEDKLLPKIADYIMSLKDLPDVRLKNRDTFCLSQLYSLNIQGFLKYYYDEGNDNDGSVDSSDSPKLSGASDSPSSNENRAKSAIVFHMEDTGSISEKTKSGKKMKHAVDHELTQYQQNLSLYLKSEKTKPES